MTKTTTTRRSRREEALINSPSPGGATGNSPTIHRWVTSGLKSRPEGTDEFSLTTSFRGVLARHRWNPTVSTVSAPSPVSQRDSINQTRVGVRRLPWENHPEHPSTLKGLHLFSGSLFSLLRRFQRVGSDESQSIGCGSSHIGVRIRQQALQNRTGARTVRASQS